LRSHPFGDSPSDIERVKEKPWERRNKKVGRYAVFLRKGGGSASVKGQAVTLSSKKRKRLGDLTSTPASLEEGGNGDIKREKKKTR